MDPNRWVDLLFTYGPYAVLALFVLWVAPRQTKTFGICPKQDKAQRFLCGSVAVGCWIVVALMVWFIYRDWPPRIIYQGSLGTYGQDTVFMTQDDDFYIATEMMRDNLLKWKFAIVIESISRRDPKRSYQFTHLYKGSPKDYEITLGDLQAGYVNLHHDLNNPDKLILEDHEPAL